MKTEDTEALTRQRAKPSKIKAQYSRPTCKNYSVCTIIILHNTVTQRQFFFSITLPPDQHHISDVAKWR